MTGARIAVLGVGRWGVHIVRDLVDLGATVVAIDHDPDAQQRARSHGAAEIRHELDPAIVDAIVVATPASTHAAILLDLSGFGGPIACEKPLTTSVDDASDVFDTLGDRLTVLHVWRYHPAIERLGELVRTGTIGAPNMLRTVRTNWTSPRTDVDPVWTLLPHDLSIAAEVLGTIPPLRWASTEVIDGRVVGAVGCFGAPGDPVLVAEVSTRSPEKVRTVSVHGTNGVASFDASEPMAVTVAHGADGSPVMHRHEVDPEPALRRELRAFIEHVEGGPSPKTDAAEGVEVVAGVAAVLRAIP